MPGDQHHVVFALILLSVALTSGDSLVSCRSMESCILPCSFQPAAEEIIHWIQLRAVIQRPVYFYKNIVVHSYYNGHDQLGHQDQHFSGRTSLFWHQISRGNASLRLSKVSEEDEGIYMCNTSTTLGNKETVIRLELKCEDSPASGEYIPKTSRPNIVAIIASVIIIIVLVAAGLILFILLKLNKLRYIKLQTATKRSKREELHSDPGVLIPLHNCEPESRQQITEEGLVSLTMSVQNHNHPGEMLLQASADIFLQDSFERFTPDIAFDEDEETYWFQCTNPGLYQCSVTGLVFNMEGEGDVDYKIVPWNRRLALHKKKPAGPLFDIKCPQQSVCQLYLPHCEDHLPYCEDHLPHCEDHSSGGCEFLSVAHVTDEGTEFIPPHKITETHVIINISGFSGYGVVEDGNSPPHPIRAYVLLLYKPPVDPSLRSVLNVLLLPVNTVARDVLHKRKKVVGYERFIDIPSKTKLHPEQEYTLSTSPEDDFILIQPKKAEFDSESYDHYIPTFQVTLKRIYEYINFLLKDNNDQCAWEMEVSLSSDAVSQPIQSGPCLSSNKRLLSRIRCKFIERVSGPVLNSLLDKLLDKQVITESERDAAAEIQNQRDMARFAIDTVKKKGEAASTEMMVIFCEEDRFLYIDLVLRENL